MDPPIRIARQTADHLLSVAEHLPGGGLRFPVPESGGPWLAYGQAGVLYFLTELARAVSDGDLERLLKQAGLVAVGIRPGLEGGAACGLLTGEAGVGLLALSLARLTGDDRFVHASRARGAWLARKMPKQTSWSDGIAGIIVFLLQLHRFTNEEQWLDQAVELGDRLLLASHTADENASLCWGDTTASEEDVPTIKTGLADGTAGCGLAMAALAWRTDHARFKDAIGVRWPARIPEADPPSLPLGWWHGAAGIGLFLQQASRLLQDDELSFWADLVAQTVSSSTEELTGNPTLGTGLAGAGWLTLDRLGPGKEEGLEAHRAQLRVSPGQANILGMRLEPFLARILRCKGEDDTWTVPDASLMQGAAGIGLFFLHLARSNLPPEPLMGG